MKLKTILNHCDHTLLATDATWEQIRATLDDAIRYQTASACIPPYYIRAARAYVGDRLTLCTVIGFPNGYATTAAKIAETRDALENGADEIDMVIAIGALKDKRYKEIENEIRQIKEVCGEHILKVIVETCLLTEEEKIRMCAIVGAAGADYIKTSTGFSKGGATFADVELMQKHVPAGLKIKAAGGIASLEDAEKFLSLGADRLGTSRLVKLAKEQENAAK